MSEPFDPRSDKFKRFFATALPYADYVATGGSNEQTRWANAGKSLALTEAQRSLLKSFTRKMHVLVLSGTWCGDCSRQGPMLDLIASASPLIECRFIDNQAHPDLRDEVRVCGGARVPVAIFFSEDFFEVARFGDRTLSYYRRKAARETGASCDSGIGAHPANELADELQDWLDVFERAQLILRTSPALRARHKD